MDVTRSILEQIVGDLKGREEFRLRGRNLNRQYDQLDVFPAVADGEVAEFSPTDEGEAPAFLLWSRKADKAFDGDGALTRPLTAWWGGSRNKLQMAFARRGLTVRLARDEAAREPYPESGTLVLSPRSAAQTCDLRRLLAAFEALAERGVLALARAGSTQSAGWEQVTETERDAEQTAVFWHDQSHDVFDELGQLGRSLALYWRGDAGLVCDELERAGFAVIRPRSEDVAIEVSPSRDPAPDIEAFAAAHEANVVAAPRKPRKPRAPAGPFTELHRFRAPNRSLRVHRLAFDPAGAALAVTQVYDQRGWPEHPLYRVEPATGAVTRVFPAHGSSGSCGGCEFLPDGRLIYSLYDFDPAPPRGTTQGIVRLLVWEPEGDVVRELAVHPLSHICNYSLSTLDAAGERVAVVTATGVSVLAVGPARATTWQEQARVGGPAVNAYPLAALSRDGRYVAWTADIGNDVRCVDTGKGATLWRENFFPGHSGGRSVRRLGFDPRAEHMVALCLRSIYGPERDGKIEVREDRRLQFLAIADGQRTLSALEDATVGLTAMAWHPDGQRLAIGNESGELELRDCPGGELLATHKVFAKGSLTAIAFDRSGAHAAVGSEKGEIAVLALR
ncbi:WD40 repeat domain-containing protein [Nannocystis radixulma]|uniref:WD40 repeat domain-containing protein n=1 Tax=Nannocystis radixulma TaxID=2995305 RepID=A0ABT5BHH4_9BACT|nr:WD40 repeat domain-containing protein [Nannocystis radixulma]MDC0672487.1 WD40 repeat domain-containing protein [Nannocystis radixulma]